MLQEALNQLHKAIIKPRNSLNELRRAFQSFEDTGPFHNDMEFRSIIQFTDRDELLNDRFARQSPWYEYVLKRIAIPEWFDRLYESVNETHTIEEWNEIRTEYLWDEILGDLLNKIDSSLDASYRAQGMCELFANYLTNRIQQTGGAQAEAFERLKMALEEFMGDLKAFREEYKRFRAMQKLDDLSAFSQTLSQKINEVRKDPKLVEAMGGLPRIDSATMDFFKK